MEYYVQRGAHITSYYAVSEGKTVMVEVRYNLDDTLDTVLLSVFTAKAGTLDAIATKVIRTYEQLTASEWKEARKGIVDIVKGV